MFLNIQTEQPLAQLKAISFQSVTQSLRSRGKNLGKAGPACPAGCITHCPHHSAEAAGGAAGARPLCCMILSSHDQTDFSMLFAGQAPRRPHTEGLVEQVSCVCSKAWPCSSRAVPSCYARPMEPGLGFSVFTDCRSRKLCTHCSMLTALPCIPPHEPVRSRERKNTDRFLRFTRSSSF